jgi:hypothetical protein
MPPPPQAKGTSGSSHRATWRSPAGIWAIAAGVTCVLAVLTSHRRRVEEIGHLPQNCEQPPGTVKVIHQEPARRLQVDQQRNVRANPVGIVQCQVDPKPSGNR